MTTRLHLARFQPGLLTKVLFRRRWSTESAPGHGQTPTDGGNRQARNTKPLEAPGQSLSVSDVSSRPDDSSAPVPVNFSELQKPLDKFRAKTIRVKVHPVELACLWVVCAHLVFLPWALGGMHPWAHFTSLALAVLGFGIALLPRNYTEEYTGSGRFRLLTWPKL